MTTYQYRCDEDGLLETAHPMGSAPPALPCPTCGWAARRVFSTPLLGRADRRAMSLVDRTEATRDTPEVVTSLPPRRGPRAVPPRPVPPALRRLPRP